MLDYEGRNTLRKNQTVRLSIESLSGDGNGVGRAGGMVVFVPHTAPGDDVDVRIAKTAKRHAFGILQAIHTPGPGRSTPECLVAGRCGGCCFQHITYAAELDAKRGFVADALHRIGHLAVEVPAVVPSPKPLRYRGKVQYPVAAGPDGGLHIGFYAPRSHRVVPCEDCLLQPQELNHIAQSALRLLAEAGITAYDEQSHEGLLRHICLRQGEGSGEVLLCLVATKPSLPGEADFAQAIAEAHPAIASVQLNHNPGNTNVIFGRNTRVLWGAGSISSTLCGVPQRLGPLSFSQVNPAAAEAMFRTAGAFARLTGSEEVLDLYCGAGIIGLSVAGQCTGLTGVEIDRDAVEHARASAAEMGLENARFLSADAGEAASTLLAEGYRPDVIFLDPPRKGCDEATLDAVGSLTPRRVVMVSCNPATLARDLALLTGRHGYQIEAIQPFDLFPRTRHVECVVALSKQP